nr:hypothetical protein [uncultured Cohaesibacter sp.]
MPLIPETYRHNISLLVDQHTSDASRIIDIGADAIRAARQALSSMPDIAVGDIFDDIRPLHALIDAVSNRCVLDPQFEEIVDDLLEALPILDEADPLAPAYAVLAPTCKRLSILPTDFWIFWPLRSNGHNRSERCKSR